MKNNIIFFFYLGFLSWTFTIHRTAGEGGGYFFKSSISLPPASRTLITAESSPLHIANSQTQTGNLWFLSANHMFYSEISKFTSFTLKFHKVASFSLKFPPLTCDLTCSKLQRYRENTDDKNLSVKHAHKIFQTSYHVNR